MQDQGHGPLLHFGEQAADSQCRTRSDGDHCRRSDQHRRDPNGSGSSDPNGTIATYNWTGTPDPANTVSPTVTLAAGSHTFSLVVTDNQGATSAADTVLITVNRAGQHAADGQCRTDQTVTIAAGQTSIAVTLNGSGSSDPNGTIATYNWTGTPDPANTVSPTVTLAAGSYTFSLVVTDNQGATSAADTV